MISVAILFAGMCTGIIIGSFALYETYDSIHHTRITW